MSDSQQQVITLNAHNSVQILLQFVEVAQKAGTYLLPESDLLKRCRDFLLAGAQDQDLDGPKARNLLIQAINKGQARGAYSLDDASVLYKVCQYVQQNLEAEVSPMPVQPQQVVVDKSEVPVVEDDLSSLSDPVPLRAPRTV
jgi:hypothetical protein